MSSGLNRRDFLKLASLLSLAQLSGPLLRTAGGQGASPFNIVILIFDTLSARHVSLYGYNRDTTPNIARFAQRATVYHAHQAAGNYTTPGTASILTGVYPWTHRALHIQGTVLPEFAEKNLFRLFAQNGWHTIAYTHNPAVTVLLNQFQAGLERLVPARELAFVDPRLSERLPGSFSQALSVDAAALWGNGDVLPTSLFISLLNKLLVKEIDQDAWARYGAQFPRGVPGFNGWHYTLEDAVDWLERQLAGLPQPHLAYVHLLPPHSPYTTRRDFIDRFKDGWLPGVKDLHFTSEYDFPQERLDDWRRQYDEYIAYVDAEFGRLVGSLERSGALDNTVFILASDHGELFERGIAGHITPAVFQPVLHVPLLIRLPGQAARQDVYTPTSNIDLLPTLLHLAGADIPGWCEGAILPPFAAAAAPPERAVLSVEAKQNSKWQPLGKASIALRQGGYKMIGYYGFGEPRFELYDLANDPEEQADLFALDKTLGGAMREELENRLRRADEPFRQGI
jgi:arylsulfatase A-like enzyme